MTRAIFKRSPLGFLIHSPLGAMVCKATPVLEIITVPVFMEDGLTYLITGANFGATQGAGTLIISNTDDGSDINVTQTVTSWADDEIQFTFDVGSLSVDDVYFIKVTGDSGAFDIAISQNGTIFQTIDMRSDTITAGSTGSGTSPGTAIFCGGDAGRYCYAFLRGSSGSPSGISSLITSSGYADGAESFFRDTPGFTIVGVTSGKTLVFGPPDHHYNIVTIGAVDASIWCSVDGLSSGYFSRAITPSAVHGFGILYEALGPSETCATSHGWTNGETAYILPLYPVSIGITSPPDGSVVWPGDTVNFDGFAYASEGNIAASITWWRVSGGGDFSIGTGASIAYTAPSSEFSVYATVVNSAGQYRKSSIINIIVVE